MLKILLEILKNLLKSPEKRSQKTQATVVTKEIIGTKPVPIATENVPISSIATKDSMKISQQGLDLIMKWEGLRTKPYLCSADVPTIGYGSTYYEDGTKVTLKDPEITKERALELLKNLVVIYEDGVKRLVKVEVKQNQFDALVCFAYNVGLDEDTDNIAEGLGDSTLLRLLNQGKYEEAGKEFIKWNKSKGKVLTGLTDRRKDEMELFLKQ